MFGTVGRRVGRIKSPNTSLQRIVSFRQYQMGPEIDWRIEEFELDEPCHVPSGELSMLDHRTLFKSKTGLNGLEGLKQQDAHIFRAHDLSEEAEAQSLNARRMDLNYFVNFPGISSRHLYELSASIFQTQTMYRLDKDRAGVLTPNALKWAETQKKDANILQKNPLVSFSGTACYVASSRDVERSRLMIGAYHSYAPFFTAHNDKVYDENNAFIAGRLVHDDHIIKVLTHAPNQRVKTYAKLLYGNPGSDLAVLECDDHCSYYQTLASGSLNTENPDYSLVAACRVEETDFKDYDGEPIADQDVLEIFGETGEVFFSCVSQKFLENDETKNLMTRFGSNEGLIRRFQDDFENKTIYKMCRIFNDVLQGSSGGYFGTNIGEIAGILIREQKNCNVITEIDDEIRRRIRQYEQQML